MKAKISEEARHMGCVLPVVKKDKDYLNTKNKWSEGWRLALRAYVHRELKMIEFSMSGRVDTSNRVRMLLRITRTIIMRIKYGRTYGDISERFKVSPARVRQTLSRATRFMSKQLAIDCEMPRPLDHISIGLFSVSLLEKIDKHYKINISDQSSKRAAKTKKRKEDERRRIDYLLAQRTALI